MHLADELEALRPRSGIDDLHPRSPTRDGLVATPYDMILNQCVPDGTSARGRAATATLTATAIGETIGFTGRNGAFRRGSPDLTTPTRWETARARRSRCAGFARKVGAGVRRAELGLATAARRR